MPNICQYIQAFKYMQLKKNKGHGKSKAIAARGIDARFQGGNARTEFSGKQGLGKMG